ncbi:MAG: YbhB/YbcL family Raf kinase inhibitor-like protein [Microbacteriaceae bacterium]
MVNDPLWRLPAVSPFTLDSPDFREGDCLPLWARSGIAGAGGEDRSPTLHWSGAPSGTQSFALTMYDPDAPTGSGWWHWAVYNIPATVDSLPADAGNPEAGLMPPGAVTLPNEIRLERYLGAAPPAGHGEHRYFFILSALDVASLDLAEGSTPGLLGFTLADHVIGRAVLTGVSETPAQ